MIGDKLVVKNGTLETKWIVQDNGTIAEYLEINTHMNKPGVWGCNFKNVSVRIRKSMQDESEGKITDDKTIWHPIISPFSQMKEQTRQENRDKKRKMVWIER